MMSLQEEQELEVELSRPYFHTLRDIRAIAHQRGTVTVYHGTNAVFARQIVAHGVRLPSTGEQVVRFVTSVYGIPYVAFTSRMYVADYGGEVARLSTAPAGVAIRWALHFKMGEVLSQLNAKARLHLATDKMVREHGVDYDDALNVLYEQSQEIANKRGASWDFNKAPDFLELPDLLASDNGQGALLAFDVDARAIPEYVVRTAQSELGYPLGYPEEIDEALLAWNTSYKDIKIVPRHLKNARIVLYTPRL
ncbi:MAG: hypothetical protein Q8R28_14960 [Dehalococcoidia bacterium]|nr:hypothetical protein [Dehalococcoidia bacterium]